MQVRSGHLVAASQIHGLVNMEIGTKFITTNGEVADRPAAWDGVLALSVGAFALVASEFMPVSLLTPIAADLHISEGQAGQAISVSGAFAVMTSLFISSLAGRLDRKVLLLSLTLLMIVSGTVVAFAPNYVAFMIGRALIGVAIGGFWSMSAATAMRLVPDQHVPTGVGDPEWWKCVGDRCGRALGKFSGRNHRLARCVLLRRSGSGCCFRLEA